MSEKCRECMTLSHSGRLKLFKKCWWDTLVILGQDQVYFMQLTQYSELSEGPFQHSSHGTSQPQSLVMFLECPTALSQISPETYECRLWTFATWTFLSLLSSATSESKSSINTMALFKASHKVLSRCQKIPTPPAPRFSFIQSWQTPPFSCFANRCYWHSLQCVPPCPGPDMTLCRAATALLDDFGWYTPY